MQLLDWFVLLITLLAIVLYGVWKTKGSTNVEDYIGGGRKSNWWTIGLSVMATQASAITFLSTPGQAFHSGMGFVQFYFGIPIAMIVVCMVFIPIYLKLKVYTVYEFLESRFDLKTRTLTAILFLVQRGLAAGITIFAPAIILSAVLGWNLTLLNFIIGVLVIIYTVSGGTEAVSVTQKQQMGIIFLGMFIAFFLILQYLPEDVGFVKALSIAGISERMKILDFSFDLSNRYTVWTGLIGGTFLMLSYFGTDQSQAQRYLSGKSVRESQLGLLFNGIVKVPMQFFILLTGIMVFVFYQFHNTPLNFNPAAEKAVLASPLSQSYLELQENLHTVQNQKEALLLSNVNSLNTVSAELKELETSEKDIREQGKAYIKQADNQVETNDKDYVFIHFILHNLPVGLVGLLLAVILSAAMSSTASELNALAATTTIDLYQRNQIEAKDDTHYVKMTKWFTVGWGGIAILVACFANLFDNLIQLVNIIGSIFYGNILGIFLLAFFITFVKSNAVFWGAIITQMIVLVVWWLDWLPFLWLNALGCILVMLISMSIQTMARSKTLKN
ncbi:sodium:solute symporter [Aquimarina sp. ERC-38]|uniref:sodium:solute symporter n=1 Tax=Aquimarina sp. ERC-38 TaxID=2949996 RepID=UPI00224733F6|nr:sodium:solute symporter [Aquimarina sp. ERC-38]UZO80168.1 sodium:solute symporter [Aquimarina sp. ERC-38]